MLMKEKNVEKEKECWERKRVLNHIWVKSESDLDQISTKSLTSSNQSWYARNSIHSSDVSWIYSSFLSMLHEIWVEIRYSWDLESLLNFRKVHQESSSRSECWVQRWSSNEIKHLKQRSLSWLCDVWQYWNSKDIKRHASI